MIKFYLFWRKIAVLDKQYILDKILRFLDQILLIYKKFLVDQILIR